MEPLSRGSAELNYNLLMSPSPHFVGDLPGLSRGPQLVDKAGDTNGRRQEIKKLSHSFKFLRKIFFGFTKHFTNSATLDRVGLVVVCLSV